MGAITVNAENLQTMPQSFEQFCNDADTNFNTDVVVPRVIS